MQESKVHIPHYLQLLDSFLYLEDPDQLEEDLHKILGATAEEVMTKPVVTIGSCDTVESLATLFAELQAILRLAIEKGGSTDRNYVNAEGEKGSYLGFAQVFRRTSQPCPRCGTAIEKIRVAGRGTHICPRCQKLSKGQK